MLDLIVRNATLPSGEKGQDIAVQDGCIAEVRPNIEGDALEVIDAGGHLVTPPFVDSHFHMDATLSLGLPRLNQSGTLLEGIALWGELKPDLTVEAIKERALALCRWSIARGTLAIRSHVDVCDDRLLAVDALLEVREAVKDWIDLQLVAFPQDGYLRYGKAPENLARALDKGDDVVVRLSLAELLWEARGRDTGTLQRIVRLAEGVENDSPVHAALLLYKGRALRGLGLWEAARDVLTRALRRKKGRPADLLRALRYERALAYEALGQRARARSEFGKLYAEDPDYEDVARRLGLY